MTLAELAKKIPKEYRDSLLAENVIYKAIGLYSDRHMRILFTIWTNYVEPNEEHDPGCPACINNILQNFKALQQTLIDLHKEEQILEEL